jgi:hypothetical protein
MKQNLNESKSISLQLKNARMKYIKKCMHALLFAQVHFSM